MYTLFSVACTVDVFFFKHVCIIWLFLCVFHCFCLDVVSLSCIYWTVCGKLVELVVKPGNNATLHCDLENFGQDIQWAKICSFQIQPLLVISAYNSLTEPVPRFHVLSKNRPTFKSYDLLIENITEADLCLYYCSSEGEKITDENGKISDKKVYHNGDTFTKLTFTTPGKLVSYCK